MELSHIPISTFSLTVAIASIVLQMGCNNDQEERIDELIDKPDTEIPAVMTEIAVPLANDSKKAAEKRKFSIFWIIVPVLLIIILLLGFKKFIAFFKKVGMLKSKLIGKVRK